MTESNKFKIKIRKSKLKQDVGVLAELLANTYDISPYNLVELTDVITAGIRGNELELVKEGNKYYIKDVESWFKERLMPNTIELSEEDYKRALYRAFRLLVLGNIAMTDFGSSRQRDFGQRWTDFCRGFLGEIGIEKFLKEKFSITVDLEEKEIGDVETFLPTDITKIKEGDKWRETRTLTSIKTSKLGSMWLDIGSQLPHSDAFIFIKIGLTVDHLLHFFKGSNFLSDLVKMAKDLGEVNDIKTEFEDLCKKISDIKPFPTYIPGFAYKKDFEKGEFKVYESRSGKKKICGGIGFFSGEPTRNFEGLGELSPPKHMACLDSLRWTNKNWKELVKTF